MQFAQRSAALLLVSFALGTAMAGAQRPVADRALPFIQLLDAEGRPLAGARVELRGIPEQPLRHPYGECWTTHIELVGAGRTDERGLLALELAGRRFGMPGSSRTMPTFRVHAATPDGRGHTRDFRVLQPGMALRLQEQETSRVRFRAIGDEPVSALEIRVLGWDRIWGLDVPEGDLDIVRRSDERGEIALPFEFRQSVTLEVRRAGKPPLRIRVPAPDPGETACEILWPPSGQAPEPPFDIETMRPSGDGKLGGLLIQVRIIDLRDEPVANVPVAIFRKTLSWPIGRIAPWELAFSDAEGLVSLRAFKPRLVRLWWRGRRIDRRFFFGVPKERFELRIDGLGR